MVGNFCEGHRKQITGEGDGNWHRLKEKSFAGTSRRDGIG